MIEGPVSRNEPKSNPCSIPLLNRRYFNATLVDHDQSQTKLEPIESSKSNRMSES